MKNTLLVILTIFLLVSLYFNFDKSNRMKSEIKSENPVTAEKIIEVNEQFDTLYLDIPTGQQSVCIWQGKSGNHEVPFIETTTANTVTGKHTFKKYELNIFNVYCMDDDGTKYTGKLKRE
jgi:hypothetical protein